MKNKIRGVGFVHCANKLGNKTILKDNPRFSLRNNTKRLSLATTLQFDYRRSTIQVLRAVVSKESSTTVRKQLADALSDEALKLVGYLHGHRSLFVAGEGFDTAAATLFRKLDTASAFPTMDELNVNRLSLPGIEAVIPIVTNKQQVLSILSQKTRLENGSTPKEKDEIVETVLLSIFQKFFRMLTYAIATYSTDYLDENSFALLENLFREMKVEKSVIMSRFDLLKKQIQQLVPHELWKDTSTVIDVLASRLHRMNIV